MNSSRTVLVIGLVWPEPTSSAAGVRMMQLIEMFLANDYKVVFSCASLKTERSAKLIEFGVTEVPIKLNNSGFDDFVKELQPTVVLYDRYIVEEQFGWRVRLNCPIVLQILDTEDLHFLRNYRQSQPDLKVSESTSFSLNKIALREIASIYRVDLSLIISEYEMRILQNNFHVPSNLLHYLPILFSQKEMEVSNITSYQNRSDFITIGNFLHPPNVDSLIYLKETIWPAIRAKLPKAVLNVYGAYPNPKIWKLSNESDGFIIRGEAKDVNEVMMKSKICLAPLRFGAGLKGKVLDAFKNGTPCILTSTASEGIVDHVEYPVCDSAETFVELALDIYNNEKSWKSLSEKGSKILQQKFEKSKFEVKFFQVIDDSLNNLENHRQINFIGAMLKHHNQQSTKYLSKWIEAKNKG
ncbi:glycosyltransferase [Aegicerativicinus sediminis]|uniref:glycosyltransferase n=1 Tax=Aegicerativicinus sediminis TaxID=2893202 RepID=UPI001E297BDD|nr:glycosyltransferase [Aegicerativicinus sediminis]